MTAIYQKLQNKFRDSVKNGTSVVEFIENHYKEIEQLADYEARFLFRQIFKSQPIDLVENVKALLFLKNSKLASLI